MNLSILTIWHEFNTLGLMVRRRAQRAVSNHGSKHEFAAILRDALASLGLLRMRSEGRKGSQPLRVTVMLSLSWLPLLAQKNASVRISMLSRGRALGGEVGSSNAVCAVQRARPSLSES